jgi:hypothetical protein
LKFLAGEPVTEYRNGHGKTILNPTPIKRNIFWFSNENEPFSFLTPQDFDRSSYEF